MGSPRLHGFTSILAGLRVCCGVEFYARRLSESSSCWSCFVCLSGSFLSDDSVFFFFFFSVCLYDNSTTISMLK